MFIYASIFEGILYMVFYCLTYVFCFCFWERERKREIEWTRWGERQRKRERKSQAKSGAWLWAPFHDIEIMTEAEIESDPQRTEASRCPSPMIFYIQIPLTSLPSVPENTHSPIWMLCSSQLQHVLQASLVPYVLFYMYSSPPGDGELEGKLLFILQALIKILPLL